MTAQTLQSGDQVIVLGSPAHRESTACTSIASIAPPTATALNRWAASRGCDRKAALNHEELEGLEDHERPSEIS